MIKLYDKNHVLLAELVKHSPPSYTWTLNGSGKADFFIGLEDSKATPENLQFMNHVEIYSGETLQWGGVIVMRDFNGPSIKINCYGYLYLFKKRRLRSKQYATMDYGNLLKTMVDDANSIAETGISVGSIATGALETTRKVENTDYALDKMTDFAETGNYNIEVSPDREFNFHLRQGSYKGNYLLEYGGRRDNIVAEPQLSVSTSEMANSVYSETSENELTSTANDMISQSAYGLSEGTYSASNSIVYQSTLDGYVSGELQRRAQPLANLKLTIVDSGLCPFSDLFVGDTIPVSLIPYWGFKENMRILEMKHDEDSATRDLTLGDIIYRPSRPDTKLYKG